MSTARAAGRPLTASLAAVAALTRAGTVVAAGLLSLVGAGLAPAGGPAARIAAASVAVALLVAFAQVVNDVVDVEVDRIQKPHRPLVSGQIAVRSATALAVVLAGAGLGAAALAGPGFLVVAAVILVLSCGYSMWWKGTVLVGNAVVALLASSPITYGAAAAGGVDVLVVAVQVEVFVFMSAFEVVKTGIDADGDAAVGLRTVATRFGVRTTSLVAAALCAGFAVAAVVPAVLADRWLGYAVVMGFGAVLPASVAAVRLVRRGRTPAELRPPFELLRLAWFAGIASLVLL